MLCRGNAGSDTLRNDRTRRFGNWLCLIALALTLAACGAFRGSPPPSIDSAQEKQDFAPYLSGDVLAKFYSPDAQLRGGMAPVQWRDAVIGARLEIIDQNFQTFKNELYAETSGVNLATDLAALGLTGAAAVASSGASRALAAAATGVIGAGTAFNKDALYQKTLPAIFAQMEANRSGVLVRIRGAQTRNATDYPLSLALTDIAAYERAGTLESGIQALTTSATNQDMANKKQLDQLSGLTIVPADVQARREKFSDYIADLVAKGQKTTLDQIAGKLGAAVDANIVVEERNILHAFVLKVNGPNAAAAMTDLSNQLNPITHETF